MDAYFPINGGVNKEETGLPSENSVDLALLELVQCAVVAYFKPLYIDLTKELASLKWPPEKEELTGTSFEDFSLLCAFNLITQLKQA